MNYLSDAFCEHIHLTFSSLVSTTDSTQHSSILLRLCEPQSFSSSLPAPHPHLPTSTCSLLRRHLIGPHIFVTSTNEDDFLAEANLTVMTPFAMSAYFPRGGIQTADKIHAQRTCKRTRGRNQNAGSMMQSRSEEAFVRGCRCLLPDRERVRQRGESAEDDEEEVVVVAEEEEWRSQSCWQPFKRRCSI